MSVNKTIYYTFVIFFIWQLEGCCSLNVYLLYSAFLHSDNQRVLFFMVPLKIIILDITWKDNALLKKIGQSSYFWVWLADGEFYLLSSVFGLTLWFTMEACVAKGLTPGTLDLEVRGSSLAHGVVSLDKELYFTLPLFTQVFNWYPRLTAGGLNPVMD